MNAREAIPRTAAPLALDANFNHDSKYFSVATENGFSIFSSDTCELYSEHETGGSLQTTAMLGSSQIVGIVSGGDRPKYDSKRIQIYDTAKQEVAATVTTTRPILNARFSATYLALIFEQGVNLYRHQPKLEKVSSYETHLNARGICDMTESFAAFPGRTAGHVQLVDLSNLRVTIIPSHTSPLVAITMSPDSEIVASASQNGTLVRLHSTRTSARLSELRRGVSPATIWGIAISPSSRLLALTSDTLTLHVFELPRTSSSSKRNSSTSLDKLSQRSDSPSLSGEQSNIQKWGGLAKLPLAPRFLSDLYSFASVTFDPGTEGSGSRTLQHASGASSSASRPQATFRKGVLGWLDDSTIAVINAGRDARYERFELSLDRAEKPVCFRVGWSRFLRPG